MRIGEKLYHIRFEIWRGGGGNGAELDVGATCQCRACATMKCGFARYGGLSPNYDRFAIREGSHARRWRAGPRRRHFPRAAASQLQTFFQRANYFPGRDLDADGRAGVAHLSDDWVRCAAWFIRICRPISNFSALAAGGTRG